MPFETGTATDHLDLFAKLRAFLTSNTGLVSASRQWTELRYNGTTRESTMQGPGLSGTNQIHVAMRVIENPGADTYLFGFQMARGYDASQAHLFQPGPSGEVFMPVLNAPMTYWLYGNGQRFILIAKVSTTYQCLYAGKFLPYGTPSEYPQPYYLGAGSGAQLRYSSTNQGLRGFFDPGSGARLLTPGGTWASPANYTDNGSGIAAPQQSGVLTWPYMPQLTASTSSKTQFDSLREAVDGSYPVLPIILFGSTPDLEIYGELDGAFYVSGFNNAAENTVNVGSDVLTVFQDGARTGRGDYVAVKNA